MKVLAVLCASAFLAAQTGCGSRVPEWRLPEPPSEAVRRSLGPVAVVTSGPIAALASLPVAGACTMSAVGAFAGMGVGLAIGLTICSSVRGGSGGGWIGAIVIGTVIVFGLMVAAVAIPLGGLIGALDGAAKGRASQEIHDGLRAIENAVARAGAPDVLRRAVIEEITRGGDVRLAGRPAAHTLLVIEGPFIGFAGPRLPDPPLRLYGEVRFRLVRVSDGAELHAVTLGFRMSERPFASWTADDAETVRVELLAGISRFAERAVEELFRMERP